MTKRGQRLVRNSGWKQALIDGRVVRSADGTINSYHTVEAAQSAVAKLLEQGLAADILHLDPLPHMADTTPTRTGDSLPRPSPLD